MIQDITAVESPVSVPVGKPRRYRLRLPFRLRPLEFGSVLVHASTAAEIADRLARATPCGLTEAELLQKLNTAEPDSLREISGIGAVLACHLVRDRERDGAFTESDQLALVNGFGASRFARLFGRASVAGDERLRLLLRLPGERDLTPRDFQPLAPQLLPPGLRRAVFTPSGGPVKMEKAIAKAQGHTLRIRRIAGWSLCLHLDSAAEKTDRLAHFLKNLPTVLRTAVVDGGYLKPANLKIAESRAPFRRETVSGLSNSLSFT